MWLLSVLDWRNCLPQTEHSNGFSPVCIFLWLDRVLSCRNCLSQKLQLKGFSPVWIFIWFDSVVVWRNSFRQIVHLYGFSPVCIFMWLVSVLSWRNNLLHSVQANGFEQLEIFTPVLSSACCDIGTTVDWAATTNDGKFCFFFCFVVKFHPVGCWASGHRSYASGNYSAVPEGSSPGIVVVRFSLVVSKVRFNVLSQPWGCFEGLSV